MRPTPTSYLALVIVLLSIFTLSSYGNPVEGRILQVQRKLRLSATEPLPEKDFFLSFGSLDGIRAGDLVTVSRTSPVVDTLAGQPLALMTDVIGELRVHHVGDSTCIARALSPRSEIFRLGDQVKTNLPTR